jgi:hypothetical protein
MSFLIIWTLISAVIGFFGRERKGGFWGFFFFSLLLSPLVAGLALLLGGRSRQAAESEERRRTARVVATVPRSRRLAAEARSPLGRLGLSWLVSILVFGFLYWVVFGFRWNSFLAAGLLSLQIGTLGFNVQLPPDSDPLWLGVLFSFQRLSVLTFAMMGVSRYLLLRQEKLADLITETSADTHKALDSLSAQLEQQARLTAGIQPVGATTAPEEHSPLSEVTHADDERVTVTVSPH